MQAQWGAAIKNCAIFRIAICQSTRPIEQHVRIAVFHVCSAAFRFTKRNKERPARCTTHDRSQTDARLRGNSFRRLRLPVVDERDGRGHGFVRGEIDQESLSIG